jgi:cyclophilin family peptidyl-prolyl cis-trans isomerase
VRKSLILVSILLTSIFFSIDLFPPVDAQVSPNPTIELDCYRDGEGFDLFTYDGVGSRMYLSCRLENPTHYVEDVNVSLHGAFSLQYNLSTYSQQSFSFFQYDYDLQTWEKIGPLAGNNHVNITVDAYNSTYVEVAFWEDYGDIHWDGSDSADGTLSSPLPPNVVTVNAKVVSASGMPCTTCPTEQENMTMVYNEAIYVKADYGIANGTMTGVPPTLQGTFVLELLPKYAPKTVASFTNHVENGRYNGTAFHRVIDNFMIQGGDIECGLSPLNSNSGCNPGTGGYSAIWYEQGEQNQPTTWTMPDEFDAELTHIPYALSMANSGANTGGSQFFIVDKDSTPSWLNEKHSVFGNVVVGYEEIDYISQVQTDAGDRPLDEVVIIGMEIIEWPPIDTDGDGVPDFEDLFPNDANETHDDDNDGVGNNSDAFPQDANETHDDDNDGVGNNSDAFPQDANETHDDDNDGVGNNSDAFPQDPEETTDTDGDGVGDNSDADPDDPTVSIPADLEINVTDTVLYVLAAAFLLMAVVLVVNRKKKPPEVMGASEVYDSDTIWNES